MAPWRSARNQFLSYLANPRAAPPDNPRRSRILYVRTGGMIEDPGNRHGTCHKRAITPIPPWRDRSRTIMLIRRFRGSLIGGSHHGERYETGFGATTGANGAAEPRYPTRLWRLLSATRPADQVAPILGPRMSRYAMTGRKASST